MSRIIAESVTWRPVPRAVLETSFLPTFSYAYTAPTITFTAPSVVYETVDVYEPCLFVEEDEREPIFIEEDAIEEEPIFITENDDGSITVSDHDDIIERNDRERERDTREHDRDIGRNSSVSTPEPQHDRSNNNRQEENDRVRDRKQDEQIISV